MQKVKWYQETDRLHDVIVAGRIRLVRNLENCEFPGKLSAEDSLMILEKMEKELAFLEEECYGGFHYLQIDALDEDSRYALKERRVINRACAEKQTSSGLFLNRKESTSITLEGEDHFRIQCLSPVAELDRLWEEAEALDEAINDRFPYAFHEKYGYLTTYPTSMGTGLRVGVTLHLPMLAAGKQFAKLVSEMSRFGVSVRGVYGDGSENYGSLYEVTNQKTLGVTEEETIALVKQMADRLVLSERKIRSVSLRDHRFDLEDELFKSYGVLSYARKLSLKEAMQYLSQLRLGQAEGLIRFEEPVNFYGLMLEIQQANTKLGASDEDREMPSRARAAFLQKQLPALKTIQEETR